MVTCTYSLATFRLRIVFHFDFLVTQFDIFHSKRIVFLYIFVFLPYNLGFNRIVNTEKRRPKTILYEIPHCLTVEDYQDCLRKLPEWRQQQAESYHALTDKFQSAKAYTLLCALLNQETGKEIVPTFGYEEYGKPFLTDFPKIHFNLSHCARAVICTIGNAPVGCDVEVIPREPDQDVLDYCFSAQEKEKIRLSAHPSIEFTRLWTQKEALLKMHGTGLTDDLPQLLTSKLATHVCFDTCISQKADYVYTVCYLTT